MSGLDGSRRRFLVVDDDRVIVELLSNRLTMVGFDAFAARDGRDALQKIESLRPDAVILDLSMPVMDGFEVLKTLGKDKCARLPILVLSARHGAADVQRAISLGARDYLAKPFNDRQLQMRITRLFRAPGQAKSLEDSFSEIESLLK
jgi:DNA-binding response OmpR family regulator